MKKITVMIPDETYNIMLDYCCYVFPNKKSIFFKDLINNAILDYCRKIR